MSPLSGEETLLIGEPKLLLSHPKTLANVFIAIVGAGVLGIPYAFKRTGWIMGFLILFFIAGSTTYCMILLVQIRRKLNSINNGVAEVNSFGNLGFAVCGTYDSWELNSVKTFTHLAPLSIFVDVVDIGAMGVVMVEELRLIMKQIQEVKAFGGVCVFFYFMGVVLFGYEGIAMVLPIESEMKDNAKFGKILALSMGLTTLMYGAFGALGYFAFGVATKDIVTSNLGPGWVSFLVQLGLCINLFFTFPLLMNPVYEIVERRFSGGRYCLWLRWLLVLFVSVVALFVPNFADFLSLVGSSVCCCLGFISPGLFHLLAFKDEQGREGCVSDVGIMTFGAVLTLSGTWFRDLVFPDGDLICEVVDSRISYEGEVSKLLV
ncbi:Amino acid transporter ANTL1 [Hibiscus syriacus]|uniref:Amino acid transporter ANTL1 n=1 Tax=Hibiscus syriacus TaxID=106335 RepID=A0A6A2XN72_HIBSY|nr:Amino acid transporter ANTL1 [Hibiscus syriacus]